MGDKELLQRLQTDDEDGDHDDMTLVLSCDDDIYYNANLGTEEEDKRIGDVEQLLHPWKN